MRGKTEPGTQEPLYTPDSTVQEVPDEKTVAVPHVSSKPTRPMYAEVARIDCEVADHTQLADFLEFVAGLLREDPSIVLVVQKRVPKKFIPETPKTQP